MPKGTGGLGLSERLVMPQVHKGLQACSTREYPSGQCRYGFWLIFPLAPQISFLHPYFPLLGTEGEERERCCNRTLHSALPSWHALTLAEGGRSESHSDKTPLHHCPLCEEGNMPSMSTTLPGQMVPSFPGRTKTLAHMSLLGNYCSTGSCSHMLPLLE